MKKFIWAWSDEYGNYINPADSLEEIVETVLASYYDYDEFIVENVDSYIVIKIFSGDDIEEFTLEATTYDVEGTLEQIAENLDRPDFFEIMPADTAEEI